MQTDDEAHPEIQRGIEADYQMAGRAKGIDVLFGGHADAGTEEPIVHPETGTLIMQTYGQGTRLGKLKLVFDEENGTIDSYHGELVPVVSDMLEPHPVIKEKLAHYRSQFPELQETVFHANDRLTRQYNTESDLGNLYADILRDVYDAEVAFINAGALRKDLPQGDVPLADLMDSFPFQDEMVVFEMTGHQIIEVLEQSLTLERGMLQVSGLVVHYDINQTEGSRVLEVASNGAVLDPSRIYRVATIEILAQGADLFSTFPKALRKTQKGTQPTFAKTLEEYLSNKGTISRPESGRLLPTTR